jgi:hypothetical protein
VEGDLKSSQTATTIAGQGIVLILVFSFYPERDPIVKNWWA